jgi:hypothetical protein
MLRRLFTVVCALSLLMCVATGSLWVRSSHRDDLVAWVTSDGHAVWVDTWPGILRISVVDNWPVPEPTRWVTCAPDRHGNAFNVPYTFWSSMSFPGPDFYWHGLSYESAPGRITYDGDYNPDWPTNTLTGHGIGGGGGVSDSIQNPRRYRVVEMPLRLPVLVFTPMPGIWLLTWGVRFLRRKSQGRRGFCRGCGYDLRATPHRCPECGGFA